ncbi:MAG: L-threonylcarbamoyladenylate synthase [Egibacteraceae bacterium]
MSEAIALEDFERARDRAVGALREGRLVVMPTDTVYAVVADAFNTQATQRVFGAKRRGRAVPLGVVIRSPRQLSGLVSEVPDCAERLMASYWPGPLTLVFNQSEGLAWDLGDNRGTVGVRLSTHELLTAVAHEVGPLVCTVAWVGYGSAPHTVEDAKGHLGDLVSLYIDGGRCDGELSTVVDVTRGRCEILRSGVIPDRHVEMVATGQVGWGQQPAEDDDEDEGA